jgi:hypothetical protein
MSLSNWQSSVPVVGSSYGSQRIQLGYIIMLKMQIIQTNVVYSLFIS